MSSFSLIILTVIVQLFLMLEGDVCASKKINLLPATGIIGHPFNAVHMQIIGQFWFCMGALEFTFTCFIEQYRGRFLVLDENW